MARKYESLWHRLCAHIEVCRYTGCWDWTGPTRRHGGGHRPALTRWIPGKGARNFNAARLMCELVHGPAPTPEHEASHLCEEIRLESNWLCICPDHLIWETKKENMARMWATRRAEADCDIDTPGITTNTIEAPF